MDAAGARKRVLITGAGGTVGTALRKHLGPQYAYRLLFFNELPEVAPGDEAVTGDVSDFESMLEVSAGVDAVVHLALAGVRRRVTQAQRARNTIEVDMRGVYNVYEAARRNGVGSVVFASTNHVTGLYEEDGLVARPDSVVRPDSIYGAGKAFGEALGRLYADRHGVRVYCLRIANFNGKDEPGGATSRGARAGSARGTWAARPALPGGRARPLRHLLRRLRGGGEKWDLSNSRELLGYAPQDDGSLPHWRERYPARA